MHLWPPGRYFNGKFKERLRLSETQIYVAQGQGVTGSTNTIKLTIFSYEDAIYRKPRSRSIVTHSLKHPSVHFFPIWNGAMIGLTHGSPNQSRPLHEYDFLFWPNLGSVDTLEAVPVPREFPQTGTSLSPMTLLRGQWGLDLLQRRREPSPSYFLAQSGTSILVVPEPARDDRRQAHLQLFTYSPVATPNCRRLLLELPDSLRNFYNSQQISFEVRYNGFHFDDHLGCIFMTNQKDHVLTMISYA